MIDNDKEKHVKQLKRKIEGWREIILPLNSILLWEKSWYPGLIFGSTTIIFFFIWMLEPTFLTLISMSLLFLALIDYLVPTVLSTFCAANTWNGLKERKFDEICQKISRTILGVQSLWKSLLNARNNRPNLYYGSITVCLSLLAWIGNSVSNLFLSYFTVTVLLLLPGLCHKKRAQSIFYLAYSCLIHRNKQS